MTPDTPATTRLILVRHGRVAGIDPPAFRGRADLPLLEAGLEDAAAARDYVGRLDRASVLFTSPLQRCVQTASIIGEPLGLEPQPIPELSDIDYGRWQGLTYAELAQREPDAFSKWIAQPDLVDIPGGESLRVLAERVAAFCQRLVETHAGQVAIAVGHDSVNRVLLLQALGLPLSRFWRLGQEPCAVNVLAHDGGDWTVCSVNETGHLRR
jgi:broad specificity phosphatase PhoE